jgi:hypothetical protein
MLWVVSSIFIWNPLISLLFLSLEAMISTDIINVDQTGYVKNRFIGFNLRQIQDIIDYADIYKNRRGYNFRWLYKGFWFFGMEFHATYS